MPATKVSVSLYLLSFIISDDELVGKMCGMYVDGNDELSSDDEDFIYSKDDDDPRHGDAYSKYKKRVAKDLLGSNSESEDDYDVDEPVESVDWYFFQMVAN